jgi:hypothetical protein
MNNCHNQKSEESLPSTKPGTMEDMEDEGTRFAMEAEEPLLSDDSIRNVLINLNQMTLAEFLGCSIDDTNHIQVFDEDMVSTQADTIVEPQNNLMLSVIKAAIELFPDEGDNDSNYDMKETDKNVKVKGGCNAKTDTNTRSDSTENIER